MSFANADSVHEENKKNHGIQAAKEPRKTYSTPRITPQQYQRNFTENSISYKITKRKRESLSGIEPVKLGKSFSATHYLHQSVLSLVTGYNEYGSRGNNNTPTKALEQVRAALQPSLNVEIERVLHSYQEMFRMAAYNVGDNLKETVTEEHISTVLRRSLEEAKSLFKVENSNTDLKSPDIKKEKIWTSARNVIIKKRKARREEREVKIDNFDYPKWDEARITDSCEFIMGVKANKILGYASARGRLYIRHPQLFKYQADQDDKQWLFENGHMPMTGGKAFLMLADDIRLLATSHPDYKDNLGIKAEDVKGYFVPEFLMKKMKLWMKQQALIREARRESAEAKDDDAKEKHDEH